MDEEWYVLQLANLRIKENRLSTLAEIRTQIHDVKYLEAIVTQKLLSAPEIYECLDQSEYKSLQIDLATDILTICMSNLSISPSDIPSVLERALKHNFPNIRALALKTMLKELQRERKNGEQQLFLPDDLLKVVLEAMQMKETEVGVPAMEILSLVLDDRLEQEYVKAALLQMVALNEIIMCRVYELAVNLAKRSPKIFKNVEFLLDRALSELDNNDVLLQVNILEILVPLAEQDHGLLYLEKRQTFAILSTRIETIDENTDRLMVQGILKFFGKVGRVQPDSIIRDYPHVMKCLFASLNSSDTALLATAFDTFANLGDSTRGKIVMDVLYEEPLNEIFKNYILNMKNFSSDLKNRAFNTLQVIFQRDKDDNPLATCDILLRWFRLMSGPANMQFLLDFCRNPFPDIKVACLSFIKMVFLQPWGINMLKETAGFVEYLLDRNVEFDKDVKLAKYELVVPLAKSELFDVQTKMQLQKFVNQGPYFVETAMEVAVEGE